MTNRFYHAEWIISEFTTSSPIASATAAVRGADQRFYQQTTFSWILSILSVSLLKTTRYCRTLVPLFSAAVSFSSVLNLCFRDGLPLHIRGHIGTPAFQWHDVVHNIAFPPVRIAGLFHVLPFRGGTAPDPAIAVPWCNRGFLRN